MQTLTKREKVLLYILLCIIILVGGLFLMVMPSMEKYTKLKADYDNAQIELQSAKASIIDYGDLDKQLKETSEDLKSVKKKFYSSMKKEDVDNLITSMTLEHGLAPVSLSIAETEEEEDVISYTQYLLQLAKKTSPSTDKNSQTMMKVYNVNLSVKGSITDVQTLVDDIRTTRSLKVSGLNYTDEASEEEKEITINFKLYMI